MYGKTMSIPDEAMADIPRTAARRAGERRPAEPACPPRDAKRALARELVALAVFAARRRRRPRRTSTACFVEHEAPEQIEEATLRQRRTASSTCPAVIAEQFGLSRSEARRLIDQGGVTLGDAQLQRASTTSRSSAPTGRC